VLEPEVVFEEARDLALEAVELRERVLAQRDEEVDAEARGVDGTREIASEAVVRVAVGVVHEVLLELVEDDEDVRRRASRPVLERRRKRLVLPVRFKGVAEDRSDGLAHRVFQPGARIVAPGAEDDGDELGRSAPREVRPGDLAEVADCAGPQHGCLADTALRIQDGEPRRQEVGLDQLLLRRAPEEERRVLLSEGHQALVGGVGQR
jgi:hypothetical protein